MWANKVYNLMRDHGQKGVPMRSLSGVAIALRDIAGKASGQPIYNLLGGAHRLSVQAYDCGMMLRRASVDDHILRIKDEAASILGMGFQADKMKTGLGPVSVVTLCEPVAAGIEGRGRVMVGAIHCYTTSDAFYAGRALDEMGAHRLEEPVAPKDLDGYRELRAGLKTNISRGERSLAVGGVAAAHFGEPRA